MSNRLRESVGMLHSSPTDAANTVHIYSSSAVHLQPGDFGDLHVACAKMCVLILNFQISNFSTEQLLLDGRKLIASGVLK